jgi:predicted nucleotidyltransferase
VKHWAEEASILRAVVGSTIHGLALEGTDDHDEMGVCIEPLELVVGLQHFEQYVYRTAEDRARHDPEEDQRYRGQTPPSRAGDTDLVIYSLRKFCRLASAGNPSILILLFAEPLMATTLGLELRQKHEMFASRQAGARFLGYLQAQRERMLGTRGQMRVTRTELIEKHGYDTKYAMHAIRLGYQGIEYLKTGKLTLPMPNIERNWLMQVRRGEWAFAAVIREIEEIEIRLKGLLDTSPLPKRPDLRAIDKFLTNAYLSTWRTA